MKRFFTVLTTFIIIITMIIAVIVVMAFIMIYLADRRKKEEKVLPVFSSLEESALENSQIMIEIENLNTSNFKDFFSDMKVLLIYAYVNPVYADKFSMIYMYDNIDNFKKYYLNKLKRLGYTSEVNKYLYEPIKINSVIVYSNLEELKSRYSNKQLNKCRNSTFYCVKIE